MSLATYKDLCVDAVDAVRAREFWSRALGLEARSRDDGTGWLAGPTPQHTVWVNAVPEPKSAKNRVHIDVHAGSIVELLTLGATVDPAFPAALPWTVLDDPDGQEFCAFIRAEPPAYRLYELGVDCAEPRSVGSWWAGVFGVDLHPGDEQQSWWYAEKVPGCPFDAFCFGPVPEPKTVKNRVHWDVEVGDLSGLVDAGATVVRAKDDQIGWTVLADPEGNEFCAFVRATD